MEHIPLESEIWLVVIYVEVERKFEKKIHVTLIPKSISKGEFIVIYFAKTSNHVTLG